MVDGSNPNRWWPGVSQVIIWYLFINPGRVEDWVGLAARGDREICWYDLLGKWNPGRSHSSTMVYPLSRQGIFIPEKPINCAYIRFTVNRKAINHHEHEINEESSTPIITEYPHLYKNSIFQFRRMHLLKSTLWIIASTFKNVRSDYFIVSEYPFKQNEDLLIYIKELLNLLFALKTTKSNLFKYMLYIIYLFRALLIFGKLFFLLYDLQHQLNFSLTEMHLKTRAKPCASFTAFQIIFE